MAAKQGLTAHISQASEDAKRAVLSRAPTSIKSHSWLSNLNTTCTIKSAPPRTPEVMTMLSVKSGWLVKRNEQHVWQRRWCCVVPHTFLYYFEAEPLMDGEEAYYTSREREQHNGAAAVGGVVENQDLLNAAVRDGLNGGDKFGGLGGGTGTEMESNVHHHSGDLLHQIPESSAAANHNSNHHHHHLPDPRGPTATSGSNLQPVGIIDLECYTNVNRTSRSEEVMELTGDAITNPDLRSFYFQAGSTGEAEEWTKAFLSDRHSALKDESEAYRQVCDSFPIQLKECADLIDRAEDKAAEAERELYRVRSTAEEGRRKALELVREVLERRCWEHGGGGGGGGGGVGTNGSDLSTVSRDGSVQKQNLERLEAVRLDVVDRLEEVIRSPESVGTMSGGVLPAASLLADYASAVIARYTDLGVELNSAEARLTQSAGIDKASLQDLRAKHERLEHDRLTDRQRSEERIGKLEADLRSTADALADAEHTLRTSRMEFQMYQSQTKTKVGEVAQHKKILKKEVIDLRKRVDEIGSERDLANHESERFATLLETERQRNLTLERYIERMEKQVSVQQNMMEMMSTGGSVRDGSILGKVVGDRDDGGGGLSLGGPSPIPSPRRSAYRPGPSPTAAEAVPPGSGPGRTAGGGGGGGGRNAPLLPRSYKSPPPPTTSSSSGRDDDRPARPAAAERDEGGGGYGSSRMLPPKGGDGDAVAAADAAAAAAVAVDPRGDGGGGADNAAPPPPSQYAGEQQNGQPLHHSPVISSSPPSVEGGSEISGGGQRTPTITLEAPESPVPAPNPPPPPAAEAFFASPRNDGNGGTAAETTATNNHDDNISAANSAEEETDVDDLRNAVLAVSRDDEEDGDGCVDGEIGRETLDDGQVTKHRGEGGERGVLVAGETDNNNNNEWSEGDVARATPAGREAIEAAAAVGARSRFMSRRERYERAVSSKTAKAGSSHYCGEDADANENNGVANVRYEMGEGPLTDQDLHQTIQDYEREDRAMRSSDMFDEMDDAKSHISELTEDRTYKQFQQETSHRPIRTELVGPPGVTRESAPLQTALMQDGPGTGSGTRHAPSPSRREKGSLYPPRYILGSGTTDEKSFVSSRSRQLEGRPPPPHSSSSPFRQGRPTRESSGSFSNGRYDDESLGSYGGSKRLSIAERARLEAEKSANTVKVSSPQLPRYEEPSERRPPSPPRSDGGSSKGSFFKKFGQKLTNAIDNSVLGVHTDSEDDYSRDSSRVSSRVETDGAEDDQQPRRLRTEQSKVDVPTVPLHVRQQMQREKQLAFLKQQGIIKDESNLRGGAGVAPAKVKSKGSSTASLGSSYRSRSLGDSGSLR